MRARKLIYESIPDMSAAIKELSFQPHRFQDCLVAVVGSACATDGTKGLLEAKTIQYCAASPLEWAKELESLYDLLGPSSILMKKVADSANHQMAIDPTILPRCILDEFPKAGSYQSRIVTGLRREATVSCSIRLWEWFWANFLRAMLSIQLDEPAQTIQEEMVEDDFFSSITRNPYLGLIHRYLTQLTHAPLKVRLINLIHIFLIEELQFKFKRREGGTPEEVKYRLKPHYLHLLYLLILGQELEEETVKNYYLFLEKIADNFSSTTVLSHNQNIRNLLRVWLTLVTRSVTVEQHLFQKLKLANEKEGWFRLARCPIDRFQHSLQNLKLSPRELTRACSAKNGILRLLEKCGEWLPTYSMLTVIEQYLAYQQRRSEMEFQRDREDQGGAVVIAIQRILLAIMEQTNNRQTVQGLHSRLNQRVGELYGRGIALNIDEKSLSRAKSISKAKAQRSGLISKQVLREGNVWAYPLQHNEFLLLYRLMHWMAEQIDRILPGRNLEEHPRVNIRIFCNPIVFLVTVAIVVAVIRTFLVG